MADSPVYRIADDHVSRFAALDPVAATFEGIEGHDSELTDYSPAAAEERAELARHTLRALAAVDPGPDGASAADRRAADLMAERLGLELELHAAGEHLRSLNVLSSPLQWIRQVFDLMPTDTVEHWERIAARLGAVPAALGSAQDALTAGLEPGLAAANRQVVGCVRQAEAWSGSQPFFPTLVERLDASGLDVPGGLRRQLEEHADRATRAYASAARYLVEEYAPRADAQDAVGEERYALMARVFNGTVLDLAETYAWGWSELARIERAMGSVCERILPGATVGEVIDLLETDPARSIDGEDNLRAWLQDLMDRTIAELDGVHFDIAPPLRRVEAMIAPPGGAAAMYYTGPSEDFSRPGRTWYPTLGRTRFPLWGEVSICYHEGVPGHHLQVAQVRYLADSLSRYQRTLGFVSGHGEGWALYAERLMGELGYLDVPDYELGMLRAQALRATRVIVDIGMHLQLPIPHDQPYHPGERWTPDLALPFVLEHSYFPEDFMRSEVDRYLGLPGQAISYKVGERVWLDAREDARARHGADFDLKRWHAFALDLGGMGLDQLREELARF